MNAVPIPCGFFLQRMGWVTDRPAGVCYEPVIGNAAMLKCRGPVTPATRHVHYEIQISRIGYGPGALCRGPTPTCSPTGRPIVFFKDMSMQMTGVGREEIEGPLAATGPPAGTPPPHPLYDRASILAFAVGKPSDAFGEPYRIFDADRRIAPPCRDRPTASWDRVIHTEPETVGAGRRRLGDRPIRHPGR